MANIDKLIVDLRMLGIKEGDIILVHTSIKGLATPGLSPDDIIAALMKLLTPEGTLLVPALSYRDVTRQFPVYHAVNTGTCIGALPERFRTEYAQYRSVHPTHSVCAWGRLAYAITAWHSLDNTPVGNHSPFMQLPKLGGRILMLGCGLRPNTFMHGVEEYARASYPLAPDPVVYTLTDENGKTWEKSYYPHNFTPLHLIQRYDRLEEVLAADELVQGNVLGGTAYLINAEAAREKAAAKIRENDYFFVDKEQSS